MNTIYIFITVRFCQVLSRRGWFAQATRLTWLRLISLELELLEQS